MLNYEEFQEAITKKFQDALPEEFNVSRVIVQKTNTEKEGLSITGKNKVAFSVYFKDMYEHYLKTNDLSDIVDKTIKCSLLDSTLIEEQGIEKLNDVEWVKNHMIMQFINTERNQELLKTLPHREFLDLSIIYRIIFEAPMEGMSSIIKNKMAENYNLSEEDLYQIAYENTRKISEPILLPSSRVYFEMFINEHDEIPDELLSLLKQQDVNEKEMYVMTNKSKCYAAAGILYDDILSELADKFESDLYVMPSSIHDMMVVSAKEYYDTEILFDMVKSANEESVALEERLSNQVYHYSRETHTFSIVTRPTYSR